MKKLLLSLWFLLLFFNYSTAQSKFRLTIGPTISYFPDAENASPKVGLAIGFNREFHLFKKFSLSSGVGFASRGAILENRTIAPYTTQPTDAFYWDINGMIGFLEIPALVNYEISTSKKIKVKLSIGPNFTFPVKDLTRFEKRKYFNNYFPGQSDLLDYDFWFEEGSGFGDNLSKKNLSNIVIINFGIQIQYSRYILEIRYIQDNRNIYNFGNLSEVYHKMNSIYFLISF